MSAGLGAGVPDRVSVIIPTYNYAHFLGASLHSARAQGVEDLEVLVIDDGSEDDTADVVADAPEVIYIRQDNQGLSAARNTGLKESTGEYVVFLDADDMFARDSLAPRVAHLKAQGAPGLNVCRTRQFATMDLFGQPELRAPWLLPPTDLALRLLHFNIAPPHAWLLHRSVADAVGWFDTGLRACEDYDYWLRALAAGYAPRYCAAGEVYYRKHGASMSADSGRQWHHDVVLHERVFSALKEERLPLQGDPLCARLAALAGAWTTLARLPGSDNADYERLLVLITTASSTLLATLQTVLAPRLLLRDYYLMALLDAALTCAARDTRASQALATLREELFGLGIDAARAERGRIPAMLTHLALDTRAAVVDRYRVARLLLR